MGEGGCSLGGKCDGLWIFQVTRETGPINSCVATLWTRICHPEMGWCNGLSDRESKPTADGRRHPTMLRNSAWHVN